MDVLERITVRIGVPHLRPAAGVALGWHLHKGGVVGDARDFRVRAVDVRSVGVADCPAKR